MKLLLALVILASASSQNLISIPLDEQSLEVESIQENYIHPERLKENFVKENEDSKPKPPVVNDTIQLYKFAQSQYYGKVLVGHPGQPFKMIFDASAAESWIPSSRCSPYANLPCFFRNRFISIKSTTFKSGGKKVTLDSDKGKLVGYFAKENFHIGHTNSSNQSFVEIEEMSAMQLLYTAYDGVLGLGFDDNPKDEFVPFLENYFKQYPKIPPIVSFYFNRDETTPKGGTVYFGTSNKKHYEGSFTYLSVTNSLIWEISMDKIEINRTLSFKNESGKVCATGCKAYINTADVNIYGPENEVKFINSLIDANYVPFLDRYEISCDKIHKLPHVTFYLAGKKFVIYGKDYVQQVKYGPVTLCLSAFTALRNSPKNYNHWGLGISFLGRYYVELNLQRKVVGFAKVVAPP